MAIPLSSLSTLGTAGLGSADLTARVNNQLITKNAGVQRLSAELARDQTRLSGLGQLSNALATFQAVAQSLDKGGLQTAATASNPAILAGVTVGGAKSGTYQVEVRQLAQSQQLTSRAQQSGTAAIGTGAATTIKIDFGTTNGSNFSVGSKQSVKLTIDASNNSLNGIAAALKAAGIDAGVARSGNGYSLVINGKTGSSESLRISVGGDASLQKLLATNPTGAQNLTQTRAAQDAKLSVDGKAITSASNIITGAIKGTALSLTKVGTTSLTVSQQDSQIGKNVTAFVEAYNRLNDSIKTLQNEDLKGDQTITRLTQQLNQLVDGTTQSSLAAIGVTRTATGALQLDTKKLDKALLADPQSVSKLFINNGSGVAEKLASKIDQFLGSKGSLQVQANAIDKDIASLTQKKTSLTAALTSQSNSLISQYTQSSSNALPGLPAGGKSLFDFLA
jgi:flagellar hook-associated protein 2